MSQTLKQTLSQQMKLTPQQVLLANLLQLPLLALEQKLKQEIELNPLLEETLEEIPEEDMENLLEKDTITEENEEISETEPSLPETKKEIDWEEVLNDDKHFEARLPRDYSAEEETEWTPPHRQSLAEYLLEQLRFTDLNEEEFRIGEYIIWNINEDGYLTYDIPQTPLAGIEAFQQQSAGENQDDRSSLPELSVQDSAVNSEKDRLNKQAEDPVELIARDLQVRPETVRKALEAIQQFDPPGIAARNLQECLLLQIRRRARSFYDDRSGTAIRILEQFFDEFLHRKYDRIRKSLDIGNEEFKAAVEQILSLNPKPGEGYITPEQNFIIPDLIVRRSGDELEVILNEPSVPRLRINEAYRRMMLEKSKTDPSSKEFLKNKLESAKWLIQSLYRRRDTLRRTMQAIVDIQKEFFLQGTDYLRPMKLEDVARAIQMDISTVSRATSGKYVQTDYGVYELKYFFSKALTSTDGDDVATRKIKETLRALIDEENKADPLTDEELTLKLKEKGYPVARRTVAKYREQLRIPAARFRKALS